MKPQRLLLSFLITLTFAYQVFSQGYSYPVPNRPLQYPGENDVVPTQDSYRRGRSRVTYGTPEDNVNSDLILEKDRPGGGRETIRERTSTRTETSSRGGGGGGGRVIEEEVIIRREPSPTPAERVVERVVEEQVVSRGSQRGSTSSSSGYSSVPIRRRIVYVDPPAATVVRRRIIYRRRNGGGSSSSSRSSSSDYVVGSGGSNTGSSTIRRTVLHGSHGGSSGSSLGSSSDHSSSTSSSSGHHRSVGGDGQTIRRRVYYTTVPSGISGSRVITRYVDRSRNSISDSEYVDKPLYTTGSYRTRYRYVTRSGCGDATSSTSSCGGGGGGNSSSRSSSSSNTGGGSTRSTTRTVVNNRQGSVGEYDDDKQDEIVDYDDEPEPQQPPMNYNGRSNSNPNSAGSGYTPPASGAGGYNAMPPRQQFVVQATPPTYVPSPPAYQYYPQQYVPAPSPTTYVAPSQPSYIPQPTYIPQAVVTVPSQAAYVPQPIAPTYAPVVQQYPSQQGYPGGIGYPPQQQNYGGVGGGYPPPGGGGGEGFGQNGGYGGNGGYPAGAGGFGSGGGGAGNGYGGGNAGRNGYGGGIAGGNGYGGGNAGGNGYGGGNVGGNGYGGPNGGGGGFGAGGSSGNGFQNGNRGRGNGGGGGRRGGGGGGRGYGSGTGRSGGGSSGARRGRSFLTPDNQDLRTSGSINHATCAFPGQTAGGGGTQREVVEEVIYDERERDAGVTREEVLNSGGNVENIQDVRDRVNNEIVREEVIEERQRFVEGGEGDNGGGAIEERFVENGDGGFTESGSSSTFTRRRTALRDDRNRKNERTRVGSGGGGSSTRYSSTNIQEQVSNNRPTERVVQRTITRESTRGSAATNRELANKAYGIGAGNDESISSSSTRRKLLETSFRKDVKAPSYGGVPDEENFNVRSNTANDVNNFRSSSSRTASSVSSQASGSSRSYSSIPDDEGESGNVIIRKTTTRILESSAPSASIESNKAIESAQVIEGGTFAASNKDQVINRGGRTSITTRTINRSSSSSSGGGRASYGSLDDDSDGSGSTQSFRVSSSRHSGSSHSGGSHSGDSHSAASNNNHQYRQLPSHYKQLMTGTPDEVAAMTGARYMYTRTAPICPSGGCSPVASLRGGSEFRAPRAPTSPSLFPAFRTQLNLEHL